MTAGAERASRARRVTHLPWRRLAAVDWVLLVAVLLVVVVQGFGTRAVVVVVAVVLVLLVLLVLNRCPVVKVVMGYYQTYRE